MTNYLNCLGTPCVRHGEQGSYAGMIEHVLLALPCSDGIDVLYEGWGHPGVLPNKGTLILDVACLPAHASSWLNNPRLQFNAARLLDS